MKYILLIIALIILLGAGWGGSRFGSPEFGAEKYWAAQYGTGGDVTATRWTTPYSSLWTTAYGALWTETFNTEIP